MNQQKRAAVLLLGLVLGVRLEIHAEPGKGISNSPMKNAAPVVLPAENGSLSLLATTAVSSNATDAANPGIYMALEADTRGAPTGRFFIAAILSPIIPTPGDISWKSRETTSAFVVPRPCLHPSQN